MTHGRAVQFDPGSEEKIAMLARRYEEGLQLFHPGDKDVKGVSGEERSEMFSLKSLRPTRIQDE